MNTCWRQWHDDADDSEISVFPCDNGARFRIVAAALNTGATVDVFATREQYAGLISMLLGQLASVGEDERLARLEADRDGWKDEALKWAKQCGAFVGAIPAKGTTTNCPIPVIERLRLAVKNYGCAWTYPDHRCSGCAHRAFCSALAEWEGR